MTETAPVSCAATLADCAPLPKTVERFRGLLEQHGAGAWRQVLANVAANPWSPVATRLHDLAVEAGLPAQAEAIAGCAEVYRKRHEEIPDTLSNAVLLGSLIVPLGITGHPRHPARTELEKEPRLTPGMLPLARRDVERFRQIIGLQRRLLDPRLSPRARRALMHRGPFREALAWLEIHGQAPEAVEHWRGFIEASGVTTSEQEGAGEFPRPRRRRRRRRRSFRPATN